ncbi:MAG: hypothetical protein ACSHYA_09640 [Opitutaceae bacterium]
MSVSPSVRPFVLPSACLLTLLAGVFIGTRLANDSGSTLSATQKSQNTAALVQGGASALEVEKLREQAFVAAEGLESEMVLSSEIADLDAFLKLAQLDPEGAAAEALAASNDLERISKLALLLSEASSEDMPGIAELLSSNRNGYERSQQMGMLYYAWGRVDAPAAVAYAEERGGRQSDMGVAVALSSWASLDPASARAWVDASENPSEYQRGLLIGWSEKNPLQALQYLSLQDNDTGLMNRWTAPQIARNLIAERGVMALDDLAAMPSGRNRQELLERLADELGEVDPVGAAARLASITDPAVLRTAVPEVAQEWAQDDPRAAIDFVSNYSDNPELYSRAMGEIIEEWAERDPYEAGTYLNEQPASPELDRSVSEFAREVADSDPGGAMSFAVSVNDDKIRTDTIRRVARDWKRSSPEEYAAWAEANPEYAPTEDNNG